MEKLKKLKIEAKLKKIESLNKSDFVSIGEELIGYYRYSPQVGDSFLFFRYENIKINDKLLPSIPFMTSTVVEIIDEFTFKTKNSIYYLIDKTKERDIKMNYLLDKDQ